MEVICYNCDGEQVNPEDLTIPADNPIYRIMEEVWRNSQCSQAAQAS